jgi:3-methyladenine DNA glycosylase AlkD
MTISEILTYLENHPNESAKKRILKRNPEFKAFGTTMKDLRDLGSKLGENHELAVKLYETNVYEAMMLATFIMPSTDVRDTVATAWARKANASSIIDQGLAHLLLKCDSYELWLKAWLKSPETSLRYAGFTLLSTYFRLESLEKLDLNLCQASLLIIKKTLLDEPITIQNAMNNAVVMAGLHVPGLLNLALDVANHIGHVMPLVAKNSCNIQSASDYLTRYIDQPQFSRVAKLNLKSKVNP